MRERKEEGKKSNMKRDQTGIGELHGDRVHQVK